MTAPDLCRLASRAFPSLTFAPIDIGSASIAQARTLSVHHRPRTDDFSVTIRGDRCDYQGTGDTIEAAHADALACRAEHELEPAETPATAVQLPLFD
jgi:hypothetical protein